MTDAAWRKYTIVYDDVHYLLAFVVTIIVKVTEVAISQIFPLLNCQIYAF
jgi:hypothetical protein